MIASGGKGDLRHSLGTTTVDLPEGHPKPKVAGATRGGRGAGHGDSPSGKDRTAGWGTPRQGSHPGELEFSPGIYRSGVGVPALVVIIPGYDVVT